MRGRRALVIATEGIELRRAVAAARRGCSAFSRRHLCFFRELKGLKVGSNVCWSCEIGENAVIASMGNRAVLEPVS